MSQSQDLIQQLTEEQRAQSHREAQQRYYYRKKGSIRNFVANTYNVNSIISNSKD